MRTPVEVQIWRLAVLFLAGIAVSILFQVYTAFRGVFRPRRFSLHFLDILFSLAILGAAAAVIFLVNWGELRLYVPISLLLGFWFSNCLVGELVYALAYRSFTLAKKGGRWTKTKVIVPSRRFISHASSKAKNWLFPPIADEDEPPAGESPTDESPGDESPPDERPTAGRPTDEPPADASPTGRPPAGEPPAAPPHGDPPNPGLPS
ncbi:MAG TPA: hypothetical protein GXX23_01390 [Firmicutes bacterium]|nr:hypothetical protein [Candidatus Fermentithermobacillaceae bacterium]